MKLLILLLLAANIAFFAYSRYAGQSGSNEAYLVSQQLNPEEIRVLTPEQAVALGGGKREAQKPCLEWGGFAEGDLARAQSALESMGLSATVSQRRVEERSSYWVFIPPQSSRQGANQKVSELKKLGVDDYFVVQDDPKYRFAISLGIFKTEEAAKARLDQVRARGVRSAQIGQRDMPTQKAYLTIRNVAQALTPKLDDFKQSYPGTELRECAVEDKKN